MKWIAVTERLPARNQTVLLTDGTHFISSKLVMTIKNDHILFSSNLDETIVIWPTHWRPLDHLKTINLTLIKNYHLYE